jgi:hypothetical protein
MTDFLTAIALIFVIEGLILALVPTAPRALYRMLSEMPPESLRMGGLLAAGVGVAAVWLLRG